MTNQPEATNPPSPTRRAPHLVGAAVLALIVALASLITYKASGAIVALASARTDGKLHAKQAWLKTEAWLTWLQPVGQTVNYFAWVIIALAFGVVIGAAVKALLPSRWIAHSLGARGVRGQWFAALAGSPLMLCSLRRARI